MLIKCFYINMYIHTSLIINYLDQWFSKCGSQASSVGIACECVRTAASAFPAASGVQLACGSLSLKVESFFTPGECTHGSGDLPQNSYPELHCECCGYCVDYCDRKREGEGERLMSVQRGQRG